MVPAGEVGSANAAVEKGVACEEVGLCGQVEGDGVGGVAGNVGDDEVVASDFQDGFFSDDFVNFVGRDFDGEAHFLDALFHDDVGRVGLVGMNAGSIGAEGGDIFDVVEVLVGEEKVGGLEGFFLQEIGEAGGGIDDEAGAVVICENVAIGLDEAAGVDEESH